MRRIPHMLRPSLIFSFPHGRGFSVPPRPRFPIPENPAQDDAHAPGHIPFREVSPPAYDRSKASTGSSFLSHREEKRSRKAAFINEPWS